MGRPDDHRVGLVVIGLTSGGAETPGLLAGG